MFDLAGIGESIVDSLDGLTSLQTVAWIDEDIQSSRYPATLPAALVTLDNLEVSTGGHSGVAAVTTWAVVVRGKQLTGPGGVLPIVDLVIDNLHGFGIGNGRLHLLSVDLHEQQAEAISYIVRFKTILRGQSLNSECP